ncbi:hypothetical protein [Actibacterium sp. D379-3]
MAKRKRLTPARDTFLTPPDLETKSLSARFGSDPAPVRAAPIAQVAGAAAASAALDEVTRELTAARAEGRLVQALPLAAVEEDHLVRDRLAADPDEMAALEASLRARGQQVPIEVVELGAGRFGLISGWRRLRALRRLHDETGESRFATVQALLRRPEGAADAYLAMVEENEIRAGLGHYERARIAAKAAELGVYADVGTALRALFASASRAKRSKIGSFVTLHRGLGDALRFPAAIPERLGLALVKALETDPGFEKRAKQALLHLNPTDAAAEQAELARLLAPKKTPRPTLDMPEDAEVIAPGVWLQVSGGALRPRYTLSGPKVTGEFRARLTAWLASDS